MAKPVARSPGKAAAVVASDHQDVEDKWARSHGSGDRSAVWGMAGAVGKAVHSVGTAAILASFPVIAIFLWHITEDCNGSLLQFLRNIAQDGGSYLAEAYPRPSWVGFTYLAAFGLIQAAFQLYIPGRTHLGPVTPQGNTPVYKANGVQSYYATLALFFVAWKYEWFSPGAVYDHMGTIISTSNMLALILCGLLVLKGRHFPSSTDSGTTGSLMFDFYWGTELFPRIGKRFDLKTWTNCRMGMMGWAVLPLCYAAKQYDTLGYVSNSMLLSVTLMEVYITKFFIWETGYWGSMDITHDRAGFYLCWGCLVWVPSIYTGPAMYLVRRPYDFHPAAAVAILVAGVASIYINYDSDRQRQVFRQTGGKATVWGKPPSMIKAQYKTGDGKVKTSLLLTSGWWGMARHFHYLPELLAAFLWSCPSGFVSFVPYFYFIFLTGLLMDRGYRDDMKCAAKYGKYWQEYCKLVPYRIIPFVF